MNFFVDSEFGLLKHIALARGYGVPEFNSYNVTEAEYIKYRDANQSWNKRAMQQQQAEFITLLEQNNVQIHFLEESYPWVFFTRDIGFVYKDTFFYSTARIFENRREEYKVLDKLFEIFDGKVIEITSSTLEGGDVIVSPDTLYIGSSCRTSKEAIKTLSQYADIKSFELDENIMHLDTRLTFLSEDCVLCHLASFTPQDAAYLMRTFDVIDLTDQEAKRLASNVFMFKPKHIVVDKQEKRVIQELKQRGFQVEVLDYAAVLSSGGGFRCATMPLVRDND